MLKWYETVGDHGDIVISSRVRLARNLAQYPFCNRLDDAEAERLINEVVESLDQLNLGENRFIYLTDQNLAGITGASLVQRYIVSPDFIKSSTNKMLALSADASISIMVNEEDHLRIQVLQSGLQLDQAYDIADKIDDAMDQCLRYAFDDQLGFLTACPSNLGTGLRASVMLHLPALEKLGALQKLAPTLSKIGLTLRGSHGEGTASIGGIYQISNQITLGISETQAIRNLEQIVMQIIEKEKEARKAVSSSNSFIDHVYRCYGTLQYARQISTEEAYRLLSDLRIGLTERLLDETPLRDRQAGDLNRLLFEIGAATLSEKTDRELTSDERDQLRATRIRAHFESLA